MRKISAAALALIVLAPACTQLRGPAILVSSPQDLSLTSVDQSAIRVAVGRFLEAYRDAATDGGARLQALAGSPLVAHWGHWLGTQAEQFPGSVTSEVKVGGIAAAAAPDVADPSIKTVVVPVAASIVTSYAPDSGQPFTKVRVLDGPMQVDATAQGWRVADFTRDGLPLSQSVLVLPNFGVTDRGVTIRVDSFLVDTNQWALGVIVANGRKTGVEVTNETAVIVDATNALVAQGTAPSSLAHVAPGSTAEGLISFAIPQDVSTTGMRLIVAAATTGDPVVVAMPLEAALRELNRSGTASASPTPAAA